MSVPFRRMFAVALAGVALGACSSATEDTTAPSTPDAAVGPESVLNFAVSQSAVFFELIDGNLTPASRTVDVSGRVVTTTPYARILSVNYSPSNVKNWLTITQRPTLMADKTLGVRLTFTVRLVPGLQNGHVATVPINVPGARNGPQTITVSIGALGCPTVTPLSYPGSVSGDLTYGDCLGTLVYPPTPYYGGPNTPFDLYAVTVPANASFVVTDFGGCSGGSGGTMCDPMLWLWDPSLNAMVAVNDDFYGLNSRMAFTSPYSAPHLYYVLGSECCGQNGPGNYGTYTISISSAATSPPVLGSSASEPVLNSMEDFRNYLRTKQQRAQQKQ